MKNKIIVLLTFFLATTSLQAQTQLRLDPFYPYSKYSIGIGMGFTKLYGDWNNSKSEPVLKVSVARNANEWVNVNFELQKGGLNDFEPKNLYTTGLNAYNNFTAGAITGNIALGELFNWPKNFLMKQLYGIYFGAGIGYMHNLTDITLKYRYSQ